MMIKVFIHGMGVIGREMFRQLWNAEGFEIVGLNDLVPLDNMVYLLKYDSIYHGWTDMNDKITADENSIIVDGKSITVYAESDAKNIPLGELKVDIVLECSGFYNSKEKMQAFIDAGARKVISCAYCGNDLPTIAYGVNQQTVTPDNTTIACPSMELQVLASVLKPLNELGKIEGSMVKAYRSFTNAQYTLDNYDSKAFTRGRAASANIAPMADGFAKSVGLVIPELNGKVIGFAYRSPMTNGSILDITLSMEGYHNVAEINACLKAASSENLGYSEDALCSSDAMSFNNPQFLAGSTMTMVSENSTLISISVVYDNIRGHCIAVARLADYVARL